MPSPDTCLVHGTLYDASGDVKPNARLRLKKVVKDDVFVSTLQVEYTTDSLGRLVDHDGVTLGIPILRDSTAYVYAEAVGLDANQRTGTALTVPDAATADIVDLIPGVPTSDVPAASQAALNAHAATKASALTLGHVRVGTGLSIDGDGILSASVVDAETVQDYLSTFFNSQTPALTYSYNDASNRVEATIANAGAQAGLMSAADKAILDALPGSVTTLSNAVTLLDSDLDALTLTVAGKQPLDATLTALAGVTVAADKLIYATGADAFSTTDLSAFARTLLDDANAAAGATTLGLGTGNSPTFAGLSLTGPLLAANGAVGAPGLSFANNTDAGFYRVGAGNFGWAIGGIRQWVMVSSLFGLESATQFGWYSPGFAAMDVMLHRDAAATLALRNGTNAQTLRLYNTYTDASNYERGFAKWNSNVYEVGTESAGTGSARSLRLISRGAAVLDFDSGGNLSAAGSFSTTGGSIVGRGNTMAFESNTRLALASNIVQTWSSGAAYSDTKVISLSRQADGVLQVGDGTANANGKVRAAEYQVAANMILTGRKSGWTLPTSTKTRNVADYSALTVGQLAEVVAALVNDLHSAGGAHGLLGV